jgi:hypothetical protein
LLPFQVPTAIFNISTEKCGRDWKVIPDGPEIILLRSQVPLSNPILSFQFDKRKMFFSLAKF